MTQHVETILAQLGNRKDPQTGAISAPIYLSTTFAHPALGQSTGYDYTRTKNPTRDILEEGLAALEGGNQAVVTSSGMSAIALVFDLFDSGAVFYVSRDLYGGSYRFFNELAARKRATFHYFDSVTELEETLTEKVTAIFLETPTNPLMNETSIEEVSRLAKAHDAYLIVDNTFLTPLRQRPLLEGADIVVHSGTKYLTGHNDILAGVIVSKHPELDARLVYLANTIGPSLSNFDCWLFIRSLKTLPLRFNQQEENAKKIVAALKEQSKIKAVYYAGQGAMISIKLQSAEMIKDFLAKLTLISFAESLGGVESLITYPTTQTHADIPKAERESYGLTPDLLRLSVGIEYAEDLISDLIQALN